MPHAGRIRKRLRVTQVQRLLASVIKRVTEDTSLSSAEFTSLTVTAQKLAEVLHRLDKEHMARVKKQREQDIFKTHPSP